MARPDQKFARYLYKFIVDVPAAVERPERHDPFVVPKMVEHAIAGHPTEVIASGAGSRWQTVHAGVCQGLSVPRLGGPMRTCYTSIACIQPPPPRTSPVPHP